MQNEEKQDAEGLFKKLLKDLKPLFKENGFRSSGQNFTIESPECWGIVNFQKSRWSNAGEKTFYINVAVTAKRLLEFAGKSSATSPMYYACEWRWRAEQLGPENQIQQWTIRDESSLTQVFDYLRNLLSKFVIPALKEKMSESYLLNDTSLTFYYPQMKACSVLLAADGRLPELQELIGRLIDKFEGGLVTKDLSTHLANLRTAFSSQMNEIESII